MISLKNIKRLYLLTILIAIVLLSAATISLFVMNYRRSGLEQIELVKQEIFRGKKEYIRDTIYRVIQDIEHERSQCFDNIERAIKQGEPFGWEATQRTVCDEAYIKELIKNRIRQTQLKDNGYIWINRVVNYDGGDDYAVREVHPNLPATEGMFLSTKAEDIKGNHPYLEELEGVKKDGEIFFQYWFKKKDSPIIQHKLTFAKLYKPYNWIIATGVYLDDIEALVQKRSALANAHIRSQVQLAVIITALTAVLVYLLSLFLSRRIDRLFSRYVKELAAREKDLEDLNAGLEDQVQERTREIRASERKYLDLYNHAPDMFVSFSPENLGVDQCNETLARVLGRDKDSLQGRPFSEFLTPESTRKLRQELLPRFCRQGTIHNAELQLLKGNGQTVDVSLIASEQTEGAGTQPLVRAIMRDISERKRVEQEKQTLEIQLRQSYKMEAVGTLAGGIAHDFNNLLGIIIGNGTMLQKKLAGQKGVLKYVDQLMVATQRAKNLVTQILKFSRQEAHNLQPLKLKPLVEESITLLRASIPKSIAIKEDFDPLDEMLQIRGDATQIQQILINLGTNAAHAMGEHGTLVVALRKKNLEQDEIPPTAKILPGRYALLSVSDTGCGIPPTVIERIFDPYFTTKDVGQGTGMGLAVVHGLVEKHAGMIQVSSTPGEGSRFDLYFPLLPSVAGPGEEQASQPRTSSGNERILLIDDEEMLAEIGSEILTEMGYLVTKETDSVAALERFREDPQAYDLVITDQTMHGLTGVELAAALLEIRPDLPIILCSGYNQRISAENIQDFGIRAFCHKPVTEEELGQAIRQVFDGADQESAR